MAQCFRLFCWYSFTFTSGLLQTLHLWFLLNHIFSNVDFTNTQSVLQRKGETNVVSNVSRIWVYSFKTLLYKETLCADTVCIRSITSYRFVCLRQRQKERNTHRSGPSFQHPPDLHGSDTLGSALPPIWAQCDPDDRGVSTGRSWGARGLHGSAVIHRRALKAES